MFILLRSLELAAVASVLKTLGSSPRITSKISTTSCRKESLQVCKSMESESIDRTTWRDCAPQEHATHHTFAKYLVLNVVGVIHLQCSCVLKCTPTAGF